MGEKKKEAEGQNPAVRRIRGWEKNPVRNVERMATC